MHQDVTPKVVIATAWVIRYVRRVTEVNRARQSGRRVQGGTVGQRAV